MQFNALLFTLFALSASAAPVADPQLNWEGLAAGIQNTVNRGVSAYRSRNLGVLGGGRLQGDINQIIDSTGVTARNRPLANSINGVVRGGTNILETGNVNAGLGKISQSTRGILSSLGL
jgi:hypothetical protein